MEMIKIGSNDMLLSFLMLFLVVGCKNETEINFDTISNSARNIYNNNATQGAYNEVEGRFLIYAGEQVQLKKVENHENYLEQTIQKQMGDINLRAKKVDSKSYLINKGVKKGELEAAMKEIEGEQLFFIEFEELQKQDLMKKYFGFDMDKPISYLSFSIHEDFSLVTQIGDTVAASYSIYERNFHVAPYEKLLVAFKNVKQDEKITLIYNDRLFKKGKQIFNFPGQDYIASHFITNTEL